MLVQTLQDLHIYVNMTITDTTETQHYLTTRQTSPLQHLRKIIVKVNDNKKVKEVRARSTKQILSAIKMRSSVDCETIVLIQCLLSDNIALHTADSQMHKRMKKKRE